jgi:uncharacterized Ntn-hydrolase superfamily protein
LLWLVVDLGVDWGDRPIAALEETWTIYQPQVEDYVRRASNPSAAPGFGVAGESQI